MKRREFLDQHWTPYPAAKSGFLVAGRLEEIRENRIELKGKGAWTLARSVSLEALNLTAEQLQEILRKDDWLALFVEQEPEPVQKQEQVQVSKHKQKPVLMQEQVQVPKYKQKPVLMQEQEPERVREIQLLAPCLEPPPSLSSSAVIQQKWFHFLERVRDFFRQKGFQEAQTPTLVPCPGTEPFLDLFSTELKVGSRAEKLFLPTSPELHLKKMLAAGYENIFEIKSCFRNGEITERHQPEFQMLEWYRSFSNLDQLIQDCLHLLEFCGAPVASFQRKSMAELFQEILQFKLTPQTSLEELKKLAQRCDLSAQDYLLWDDVFYLIFIEKIEPLIPSQEPFFLEKYPPSQAALARLTPEGWGERFELYWKGLEIANAFHELNDPQIQAQRFHEDLEKKQSLGKEIPALDQDFLRALKSGMPPASGIALGLERLFMALNGISEISELKVFPYDRPK